ncbi:MAG: hypothetical protein ABSG37_13445 [Candidatus Limnocylindrales bacterium]|jgi:hypothetical protein
MNERTRPLSANVAALEALTDRRTRSHQFAALLLRLRRSRRLAEPTQDSNGEGPSGVLDGLDDHERANLRVILREAIAAREAEQT